MRNFRDLTIWQDAVLFAKSIYALCESLPSSEKYGLTSQLCRAAVSIPSNIAEGCSRAGEKDFKHFLEIAIGSAFELETQLIIVAEIGFVKKTTVEERLTELHTLQAKINAFIGKINDRGKTGVGV